MKNNFISALLPSLFLIPLTSVPAHAGIEPVLGKWLGTAETADGPIEMVFELKQEGGRLVGTADIMQETVTFSTVKFEEPNLTVELSFGGRDYRLLGTLKDGKFMGTWEQVGGDVKGTWNAEHKPAAAAATPAAGNISGSWDSVSVTPNGELALTLDLKQEGERVTGELSSEMGTISLQAVTFKENKLQFDVDLGGTVYRVEGNLEETKFEGKWYPVAGGEGGAWSATRKSPVAVSASVAAPDQIHGTWNAIAVTPGGDLSFQVVFKQANGVRLGQIITPDGTIELQKVSFSDNKLSFEVDYMGATYRLEAILDSNKLVGKWSSVEGSETGAWSAVQKP